MDVDAAQRLAGEAVRALERAHYARLEWLRAERDDHGAETEWLEARSLAFGATAVAARLAALVEGAPAAEEFEVEEVDDFDPPLQAALRLEALLANHRELQRVASSTAPSLSIESLHRWVRSAASSLWSDGHHRAAIHAAASQVELHLQAKLGRHDLSGASLVRQAFSLDGPQPGKPRLRFPAFREGSERFNSIHEGAGSFGAGLIQAFRNTAAHDPLRPISEDIAFEQLVAFSLLARTVASATVVRHRDSVDEA